MTTTHSDETVRAVIERLYHEHPELPSQVVRGVVRASLNDLAGVPPEALPELLERLARERLRD